MRPKNGDGESAGGCGEDESLLTNGLSVEGVVSKQANIGRTGITPAERQEMF